MVWTAPRTWVTGEILSSSNMNTHVRDNLLYLHGGAGDIVLAGGVQHMQIGTHYAVRSNVASPFIQAAQFNLSSAGSTGTAAVTWPVAFTTITSVVVCQLIASTGLLTASSWYVYSQATTGATFAAGSGIGSPWGPVLMQYMAIGTL